jgi:hypothetical protein
VAFKIGNQTVIQDIDASAVIETNSNLDKLQIGGVDVFTHDGASPPKITLKNVDIADLTEASINTDNVTEGSTNLFFTDARAVSALTSTTSALAADIGTNTGNINTKLPLAGGTLTGALTLSGAPTNANHASTKAYVDSSISSGTSSLDTDDIAEAGNLYYTDARVNTLLGTKNYATETYADTAEADAISTAAADATTKANAALASAQSYADTAEADAISTAAATAASLDTAQTTAITTAYQTYADQAEADAISTAAADATTKADAAQAAAEATAAGANTSLQTAMESYADQAEVDAKAYTDTRETAITTAYESYADQAEVDAKAYTDTAVAGVVDSAPATLDTLNELAAALGDDPNLSTTLTTAIGTKVAKAGDTMTGALTLSGAPSSANHAATKAYVDSSVSGGTGALDTDDIAEAGNLYYTDARVNTIFNAKTTSDLTEGTNLYYTNARVDARIPTNVSSFTNDSSYATTSQLFSGSYTDLSNKPTIPTNNNQLTNGAGYITSFTNTTYTAGTGLNLVGTEFQNTAPDQTVSLTGSGATSISGTYPNFTISSTDTNTDTNTTYTAGNGLTLTGTEFKMSGSYTGDFGVTGELSVGTLTPGQELTVQSTNPGVRLNDTTITGLYHDMVSFGDNLRFNADVGNVDADTQIQFYIDNTEKMVLSSSALSVTGEITASGDVTAFSDERLKSNITTIEDALDKVKAMRGVMFDKTDSLSGDLRQSIGVIAQEVEQVLPEVVHNDSNTGYKSVAYGNIVGVLIEAIKEQQSQIENLIQEVEFLKGKR